MTRRSLFRSLAMALGVISLVCRVLRRQRRGSLSAAGVRPGAELPDGRRYWRSRPGSDAGCGGYRFSRSDAQTAAKRLHQIEYSTANYCQDLFIPLLSHAHLPHARERDKSAEVGVTHQPKVCNPSAEGPLRPISRTCTRGWLRSRDSNPEPCVNRSAKLVQE